MRALVFDFDGLILDTETPEFTVWTETFHSYGVEMPPDYWTDVIGRGAEQEIERPPQLLFRLTGAEEVLTPTFYEELRVRIRAAIELEQVRPGVERLLWEAKEAGMGLGVASSSKHIWVDKYLKKLGLFERFDHVVCADDVHRAKPFPDLYLQCCSQLGVSSDAAVALEDSPNGLAAAKAAGLFAVVVPNSVTARLDLSAADLRVDSLETTGLEGLLFSTKTRRAQSFTQ
ncbi:MAG TPA: HAD-IA family hydrolase [Fimbriimonas sp.]|nr:HAD-IA family hydrolase [Fimbriimonas sp.]